MTLDPAYPQGGGGTTPIDLPDGSIPKVIGNQLVASALVEGSVKVESGKTISAPAASLDLGANLKMSNHGSVPQFFDTAYGVESLPVIADHNDDGSLTPINYKLAPFEIRPSQPLDGDSFSGTLLQFQAVAPLFAGTFIVSPFGSLVLELTFRGDGVQTDGLRITMSRNSYTGPIIWQSINDVQFADGEGYTINATGDTMIRLAAPFILRDGENLFVTMDVLPANNISLKGNQGVEFVPYLITKIQEVTLQNMATEEFAADAGATAWGDITGTLADQTDLQSELDLKEDTSQKGVANGYAPLDGSSHVPAANLPSYVDDVLEFANLAAFPVTGETGKIYIAIDTNLTYRWSGSIYVELTDTTAVWGNVSGLLSNQTDLQAALDDKLATVTSDASLSGAGTSGSPLSVAGGAAVYGTEYQAWESLAETLNNTTTPLVKIDADTTVLPIGGYEIEVTYSYKYEDGASMIYHAVLINDVITGTELQEEMKDNMNYMPAARKFNYTVAGAASINLKLQFRASTAGKKAKMADAVITIIRVS